MTSEDKPATIEQPTKPLDVDGVSAMTIGTALWAAAFVILLITGTRFSDSNGWWLSVCAAGCGIGVIGMLFTRRRAAVYRAHAQAQQTQ